MKKILENLKYSGAGVAMASACILAAAYVSQYGFGLDPCQLCYYQRGPYFVNIVLGILAFLAAPRLARALLFLAALSFFIDAAIAAFHVGVEQHWWKGLESCSNYAMPDHATAEELKKFIMSRNIVRCDVPAFVLFGISMAGYNFIAALCLAAATTVAAWRGK